MHLFARDRTSTIVTLNNEAAALLNNGRPADAERLLRQAIRMEPDSPLCLSNLALACQDQGRMDEATSILRHRLAIVSAAECPHSDAICNMELAGSLLASGDYEASLLSYEWRRLLRRTKPCRRPPGATEWTGDPLRARRLYVYAEQGAGDVLQFARFLPILARDATVVVEAPSSPARPPGRLARKRT